MSILTRTVSYTDSTGTTLQSHFAYPAQGEKAAAVLVAPEWWGLSEHAKNSAERLAEQGYAALATDLYGNAMLTEDAAVAGENMMKLVNNPELLAERTQLALDALVAQAESDGERLAAIGFCFGGRVVLEAARNGAPLKAVASFHGNLTPSKPAEKGAIKGELLIEHGELDTLVTMEDVEAFRAEMEAAEARFYIDVFLNAKHGFTNPKATHNGERNGVDLGYQQEAAEQSWQNMLDLFKRVL
ncbi:dienelactone hydrolase family protein [Neisseria sp. N95_16]|uniref:Dienelactone hydrolase family protein n=1 Tax=Neisseria brasiliensis TaxID=2666100 RepID=A0A7X2GYG5_9NEIS|nr:MULTISPECIES: dienelactone hydrolase family protein [Neisseria]MRN38278.1 dienelactone hydrolase family protein [Neisseria brasiliensis]PJO09804.1 dienelactone hydrolase family protein [Neisseria sp. N95_16]